MGKDTHRLQSHIAWFNSEHNRLVAGQLLIAPASMPQSPHLQGGVNNSLSFPGLWTEKMGSHI